MTDRLKRIVTYTILWGIFLGISTTGVVADGTEQLGDPSITIAQGSGIVASGTGLISGTGTIKIDVPIGTTVKQVLLYWEGQQRYPGIGDDSIIVNSNPITGTRIGGPTYFFNYVYSSTYRADITSLGLIIPGSNTLSVSELAFDYASNGAGILVIYDDGTNANLILKDGNDLAYAGTWVVPGSTFLPPLNTTVEQEFIFTAENYDRTAKITMFFSSVSGTMSQYGFRPSAINITIEGTTTQIVNQLDSKNGQEWDTLIADVTIPAQATSLKVQALSVDIPGGTGDPASFAWNAAALSLPLPASIGDRVWIDANNNGIQEVGEIGKADVTVQLQDCNGNIKATTATDVGGMYSFVGLTPGDYNIRFILPDGTVFSPKDNPATSDALDSDADTTGLTACTTLSPGENDINWDAGLVPKASIGDRVWIDANNNGIQDAGESGYSGATVSLQTCAGAAMGTTTTNTAGIYSFTGLIPGSYKVIFTLPTGYIFSLQDQGSNDAKDSDADINTGITSCTILSPGENDITWDAGIYRQMSPGTGTPGYWKNHPEAWPVDNILIGGITYTKAQAIAIIELSVNGDKTYTMFPALVSAMLNVKIGNDASCIAGTISAADAWMESHPVGSGVDGSSQAWKMGEPLYIKMDNYNNGLLCAPHRD